MRQREEKPAAFFCPLKVASSLKNRAVGYLLPSARQKKGRALARETSLPQLVADAFLGNKRF